MTTEAKKAFASDFLQALADAYVQENTGNPDATAALSETLQDIFAGILSRQVDEVDGEMVPNAVFVDTLGPVFTFVASAPDARPAAAGPIAGYTEAMKETAVEEAQPEVPEPLELTADAVLTQNAEGGFLVGDQPLDTFNGIDIQDGVELSAAGAVLSAFLDTNNSLTGAGTLNLTGNLTDTSLDISALAVETRFADDDITVGVDQVLKLTTAQGDGVELAGVSGKVEFVVDDPDSQPVINANGINQVEFLFDDEVTLSLDAESTLIAGGLDTLLVANGGEVDITDIPVANISAWDTVELNSGLSATPAQIALFGDFTGAGNLNAVVNSLQEVTDLIEALQGGKLAGLQGRFDVDARTEEAATAAENNRAALEEAAGVTFEVTRPLTLEQALAAQAAGELPERFNLADEISNLTETDEDVQALLAAARSINVLDPATIAEIAALDEVAGVALGKISYDLTSGNAGTDLRAAEAQAAKTVVDGALNRADLTFEATLFDTLANLEAAQAFIAENGLTYQLLADAELGELSLAQIALVEGATNAEAFAYTVRDTLENIVAAQVDTDYALSNAPGLLPNLSVQEGRALQAATNAEEYTYTLADTLGALTNPANAALVEGAEAYALTNEVAEITDLTLVEYDFVAQASNFADFDQVSLSDTLANLVARAFPPEPEEGENGEEAENGEDDAGEGEPEAGGLPEGVPYSVTDPEQENLLVREAEILMGATNADEATYTLRDTLENLAAAEEIVEGATSYELSNEDLNLGPLSVAQFKLAENATNSDIYEFSLAADQPELGELSVNQLLDIAPDAETQTFSLRDDYSNIETLIDDDDAHAWLAYATQITITDDPEAETPVDPTTVENIEDLLDISVIDGDDQVVRVQLEDLVFNLKDTADNLLANLDAVEAAAEDENLEDVAAIVAQADQLYVEDTVTGREDFSRLLENGAVEFEAVDADGATAAQMNQIVANADKIAEGGLSGVGTLSASQFVLDEVLMALAADGVDEIVNFEAATDEQKAIILANLDKIGTNPTFEFEDGQVLTVAQYNQADPDSFDDDGQAVEVNIDATDASPEQIAQFISTTFDVTKIKDGGISSIKLTAGQFKTISDNQGVAKLAAAGVIELNGVDPDADPEVAYGKDELEVIANNIAKVADSALINLLITDDLSAQQIRTLLSKATDASVDASSITSDSKLFEIADNIGAIEAGGIEGLTLNGTLNEDLIGTLLSKSQDADIDASGMTLPMLQAVVTYIGNVANEGITGLTLDAGFTADALATLLSKAKEATVDAEGMGLAQLRNVAADTDGIKAAGITSLSVDNQLTGTELTNLLEKATEATADADGMTTAQLRAVATLTANVAEQGITNLSIAGNSLFADEIGDLLGKAIGATVDATATMTEDRREAVQENFAGVGELTAGDRDLDKIDPDDLGGQTITGTGTLKLDMDNAAEAINFSGVLEGLDVVLTKTGTINMTTADIADVASLTVGNNVELQLRQTQIDELGDKLTGADPQTNVLDLSALKGTEHTEDLSDLTVTDTSGDADVDFTVHLADFNDAGNKSDLEDGRDEGTKSDFTIDLPDLSEIDGTLEIINMTIGQENGEPNDILDFSATSEVTDDSTLVDAISGITVSQGTQGLGGDAANLQSYLTLEIELDDGDNSTDTGMVILTDVINAANAEFSYTDGQGDTVDLVLTAGDTLTDAEILGLLGVLDEDTGTGNLVYT